MDFILLTLVIISVVANFFISKYFINRIFKLFSAYRSETLKFSETQKQNTEKLVALLNKLFVTSETPPEPNDIGKVNVDEIAFSEENPINLPKDLKFEVEGGDTSIPAGYS